MVRKRNAKRRKQGLRRATGLARTLVVASATLAILLVCFSIYQYSQADPETFARRAKARPPSVSPEAFDERGPLDAASATVPIGQGIVGKAHRVNLSFYPRQGTRARFELSVRDYEPIAGAANEFRLVEPEVRLRTEAGNAVRVTAREGFLEARRKTGEGLDPRRGRLIGDVTVEIDRRTDADRERLPEAQRSELRPEDVVRIELDEIEFDLEYAKVRVPGPLHLTARDVDLTTSDLLVRFNETENRVEYLRMGRGGRLELREQGGQLGLSLPGADTGGQERQTLIEWLRATIQAQIDAQASALPSEPPDETETEGVDGEEAVGGDDVPVFSADDDDEEPSPPIWYFARFEGNIDATQLRGEVVLSRLQSDVLEIHRDFTGEDQARAESAASSPGGEDESGEPPPEERIVLNWTTRLVVEALTPDDDRPDDGPRSRITATGSPVRISYDEGDATCSKLVFEPDEGNVWLYGSRLDPVVARSADQGTMVGVEIYSQRTDSELHVEVSGPGALLRDGEGRTEVAPASALDDPRGSVIEFGDRLEVDGRMVSKTTVGLLTGVSRKESRVLDRATFTGKVMMVEDGTSVDADELTLTFAPGSGSGADRQVVRRVQGRGHVVMVRNEDRLSCREIDMVLATDGDGKEAPLTATALGDVSATQGSRTIRARDRLTVGFEAGLVRHLHAFGEVSVLDPAQALELTANELVCTVTEDRETSEQVIETALLTGLEDRPAFVRLDTFTIAGREISLDVPEQLARVPGAGRMTFQSLRDLDGRKASQPIPVSIEWSERMSFEGLQNQATFFGVVHASSQRGTTFDCDDQLIVEFEDSATRSLETEATQDWWIFTGLADRLSKATTAESSSPFRERFSKQPVYILAMGNAVVEAAEFDPRSGELKSRSRISGPRLSVDLRPEVSKMLIEGSGDLQLEDFRQASKQPKEEPRGDGTKDGRVSRSSGTGSVPDGLFGFDDDAGPSKTFIQWNEFMWYDFSIDQTRFEGDVVLKHFSGAELERIFGSPGGERVGLSPGRSAFLNCDVLTVDFLKRDRGSAGFKQSVESDGRRMGGLSSERLRQFHALGSVSLQDRGISLTAEEVTYERPRDLLMVLGSERRPAHIVLQKPGELPREFSASRFTYDIATGRYRIWGSKIKGR